MTHDAPAVELLTDAFGRIRELVVGLTDGATTDLLTYRPAPEANPIGWLIWHLTRVQDSHIAELAGGRERWAADGWVDRFDLDLPASASGYGATTEEVAALDGTSAELLEGYHRAVHDATVTYLETLDGDALRRVVDRSWDPPVTASARLVSVIGDRLQHLGQAAYLRGLAS
jgi:hypothetical protein